MEDLNAHKEILKVLLREMITSFICINIWIKFYTLRREVCALYTVPDGFLSELLMKKCEGKA